MRQDEVVVGVSKEVRTDVEERQPINLWRLGDPQIREVVRRVQAVLSSAHWTPSSSAHWTPVRDEAAAEGSRDKRRRTAGQEGNREARLSAKGQASPGGELTRSPEHRGGWGGREGRGGEDARARPSPASQLLPPGT